MYEAGYDVVRKSEGDHTEWNRLVNESSQGTPFHLIESLKLLAEYSDMEIHPFVSYKGQEIVGLFPVFELSFSFASAVFSPPPKLRVPYLGPVLMDHHHLPGNSLERRQWRHVRSVVEHIESESSPQYMHFRSSFNCRDPRPFGWDGFDVSTGFTYVVDLSPGREQLFDQFSRDVRSNVRDCDDAGCTIEVDGRESVKRIFDQTQSRLRDRGKSHPFDALFLEELYERLPSGAVRPYICTIEGEYVGGNIILTTENAWYPWVGAATPDVDLGINDAIHWRAMQDCIDGGGTSYDLVGAENERISEYKSKFAPHVEPFYTVRKQPQYMKVVERLYNAVN